MYCMGDHDQCIGRYLIEYRSIYQSSVDRCIDRYSYQSIYLVVHQDFTKTSPILHQYFTFTECIGWYRSIYQLIHWSTQKGDGLIVPMYFWNLNFVKSFPQKFHLPIQQVTSGLIHYPNWKIYSRVSDITWWCDSAQLTSNRIQWHNS